MSPPISWPTPLNCRSETAARVGLTTFLLGTLLCLGPSLSQAQVTWTGEGDGTSWSDSANWSTGQVPGSEDDVVIDLTPGSSYTVEVTSARSVASLTLNSSDATLEANADLTVNGPYSHENGRFTGSGTFTVEGSLNWERERMAGSGTTIANGGASIAGGLTLDTRRLVIPTGQTAVYTGAYDFVATNGAVLEIESGATFDIQDFGNLAVGSNSSSQPAIVNRGVFKKTSRGGTRVAWALENEGTVEATPSGTDSGRRLRFTGPVTDNGGSYRATDGTLSLRPPSSVTFGSGSQLSAADTATVNLGTTANNTSIPIDVEGSLDIKGDLSVGGGDHAAVTILSTATVTDLGASALIVDNRGRLTVETTDPLSVGDLTIGFEGRLTMSSDLTVTGAYTQDPDPSRFASDHALTVEGAFRWEGGTMAGSGTTVAESGLELTGGFGSSSNSKLLDERRLVVPTGETAAYPGAYMTGANGATIEIESGATFDIQGQANLSVGPNSSARPTLLNRGTLKKTGDYGTEIGWRVENEGLVEADLPITGSNRYLRITGPLADNGGTYRILNGRLSFFATTQDIVFGPGSVIRADSSGTIRFGRVSGLSTDTVSTRIEGTYDVKGTTRVQPSNNIAAVTIASGATLQDLAASELIVKESGKLTVGTTDPLTVGDLRLGNQGRLEVSSDLTVTGTYTQNPDPNVFVSDHALTVKGLLTWEGGTMAGADTTVAKGGLRLPGGFGSSSNGKRLTRRVLVLPSGTAGTYSGAYMSAAEGAGLRIRPDATFEIQTRAGLSVDSDTSAHPSIHNDGTLLATNGRSDVEWNVTNNDTLDIKGPDGHLRFVGALRSTGTVHVRSDAQLTTESDSGLVNHGALDVDGRLLTEFPVRNEGGTVTAAGPAEFVQGTIDRIPNDPDTVLHIDGGKLRGDAVLSGHVTNRGGTILPGGKESAGYLDVQGTYVQGPEADLGVEFGGSAAKSEYDQIETDRANLAGELAFTLMDGYTPDSTDILSPILWTDTTRTGTFDVVSGQNQGDLLLAIQYEPTALQVYDGSVSAPAFAKVPKYKVKSPPNVREGRETSFTFSASIDSTVTQDVLATVSPSGSDGEDIHSIDCPDTGDYDEFRCRLERFGVTPPPPPEGESYPDLGDEKLFGTSPGGEDLAPEGNVASLSGMGTTSRSGGASDSKKKECGGGNLSAKLTVGEQLMSSGQFKMCAFDLATLALNVVPGSDCFDLAKTVTSKVGSGFVKGQFDHEGYAMAAVLDAADCASDFTPGKWVKVAQKVHSTYSAAGGIKGAVDSCVPSTASVSPKKSSTRCVGSTDPNDKFGPPGVNSEQYTTRQDSLSYTVFFENKPDATAPAQDVVVTDTLTADRFDASTFSFGPVAFGDTTIFTPDDTLQFSTNVDLRPDRDIIVDLEGKLDESAGIITWTFESVDPDSSGLGATEGFLPPNDNPPEGEGSVSYFTSLEDSVTSGTQFGRAARIVFDNNDPIDTRVWSNILDVEPPKTRVDSLPENLKRTTFDVRWSGSDAESGIRSYTVFVSENGGPFREWKSGVTDTSATFEGAPGNTYSFYSVATDSVSLTEEKPATPDAKTKVVSNPTINYAVSRSFRDASGPQDYRLVALPGQVDRPLGQAISGDAGTAWQAFWDDGSAEDFFQKYDGSDQFTFRPGVGFWLTSRQTWALEDSVKSVTLGQDEAASVPLHKGWNIIANPLRKDVTWAQVKAAHSDSLRALWRFDGSFAQADTFRSARGGEAFYFLNDTGLDSLTVPFPKSESGKENSEHKEGGRMLTVFAWQDRTETDSSVVRVGFRKSASESLDRFDEPAPPARFAPLSLRLQSAGDASKRRRSLMTEVRPPAPGSEEGHTFQLRLRAKREDPIRLAANGLKANGSTEAKLLHPSAGRSYDLEEGDPVTVEGADSTAALKLAVGSASYVEEQAEAIVPGEVTLTSYPNPTRKQATVEYALPEPTDVRIAVYDVLGRQVAVLEEGRKQAGRHRVPLEVSELSSGVYFGRLKTDDQVRTRKITVVR